MRHDFRIKMDLSKIYQDARQYSWIFIDSTKILYVSHLAEHVQKIFNIKKPFHFLSRFEDMHCFLPFEEDIRILQNNDSVVIVPGTGFSSTTELDNGEIATHSKQENGFVEPMQYKETDSVVTSEKSSMQNTLESTSVASINSSLYRTALHQAEVEDSKISEDNLTEDNNSIVEQNNVSKKRKRIRKKKQKKSTESVAESDASIVESSGKKPKIIDSILISSGKHIRFKGLDEEEVTSDTNVTNENSVRSVPKSFITQNKYVNTNLSALINLRQSSTPLTFTHKRLKKDYDQPKIEEAEMTIETNETINSNANSNTSVKPSIENDKIKDNSQLSRSNIDNDTISFKVFRMKDDYCPQLSDLIIAKVISYNADTTQYTLKVLHGKEELKEPEGKFSLPKDEQENDEINDIFTLEKSRLIELQKVKAIGTPL